MINHTLKLIKKILTVDMIIKLFVVMMINTADQFRFIQVEMLYTNSWKKMLEEVKYCKNIMKTKFNKKLVMTKEDIENFSKADECHICNKKYMKKDVIVRDHCHITGKFRGSSHQDCNLNYRLTDKIPIIFIA